MLKTYIGTICLLAAFLFSCTSPVPEPVVNKNPLKELTDSTALNSLKFGTSLQQVRLDTSVEYVENKITEVRFDQVITELESSVKIDTHSFKAYYYFTPANTLYKLVLIKKTSLDLRNYPHDGYHDSYSALFRIFHQSYGNGTIVKSKLRHYKLAWDLRNKNILLERFIFQGEGTIECTLLEKNLLHQFDKNVVKYKARTHYNHWRTSHS